MTRLNAESFDIFKISLIRRFFVAVFFPGTENGAYPIQVIWVHTKVIYEYNYAFNLLHPAIDIKYIKYR